MSHGGRKDDHIRINLEEDVEFHQLTTGFEEYRFVHQALPEIDLAEVNTSISLFGKTLSAPILVSSMTGGTSKAGLFNRRLAEAVQQQRLAMGVGSQRTALEDNRTASSFTVRKFAPDALIFANLGAIQLNYGYTVDHCRRAVEMVEADALILHLNPLQEVLQPEGDARWGGLLSKIETVCSKLDVPVVVKEVGWGISEQAARLLINAGASALDVAGAGGTSWSEVEKHRAQSEKQRRLAASFREWGIPTAASIAFVSSARADADRPDVRIFASGGMRSGQDVAKAVALGADLVGLASPFLRRAVESTEAVVEEMDFLSAEMRVAMFASGAKDIETLRRPGVLINANEANAQGRLLQLSENRHASGKVARHQALPFATSAFSNVNYARDAEGDSSRRASAESLPEARERLGESPGTAKTDSQPLAKFASHWLPRLEEEMRTILAKRRPLQTKHYEMMHYHMGWADEDLLAVALPAGKRIRPLLCLLACEAVGGDPVKALPAAAAVEILHNFSLVHDDIEDGDKVRRHRPTLWTIWGVPQAINVGDGMFSLAYAALLRSSAQSYSDLHSSSTPAASTVLAAIECFTGICIELTEGQHLDLSFEEREDVSVDQYLLMIEGKTAALIAGSIALGVLFGGGDSRQTEELRKFGRNVGLAFQIQDDILGIWGDPELTGKSAGNDFLHRKKSLPLIYGLEHADSSSRMKELWRNEVSEESLPELLGLLQGIGARNWCEDTLKQVHEEALDALYNALGDRADRSLLLTLAAGLLRRQI